jgi:hypothetical protein
MDFQNRCCSKSTVQRVPHPLQLVTTKVKMRTSWTEAADFIKVTHFPPKTSSETDLPPGRSFAKKKKTRFHKIGGKHTPHTHIKLSLGQKSQQQRTKILVSRNHTDARTRNYPQTATDKPKEAN